MARPALPYRSPLLLIPATSKLVWIRRLPWYDRPMQGEVTGPDGVLITARVAETPDAWIAIQVPWQRIHSWKFQFLSDEAAYRAMRATDWPA